MTVAPSVAEAEAMSLASVLTDTALRSAAGATYYARGAAYLARGLVKRLHATDSEVSAAVHGTERYAVRLWAKGRRLDWSCTCPLGEEGEACKHVVATGLAWLAGGASPPARSRKREPSPLEAFVRGAGTDMLAELILERTRTDADFETWLLSKAQQHGFRSDQALARAIEHALDLDAQLNYYETPTYVAKAEQAAELLESVCESGDHRAAVEYSEHALRLGFDAYEQIDDSDGGFGEVLNRIVEVHRRACEQAALPAEELAERLFELVMADHWGVVSVPAYARALGRKGRARFAEIVRRAWSALPELEPGRQPRAGSGNRYLLTGLMRDIAAESGDVDDMVAVEQRDLSFSGGFLRIAEILTGARRHDEALAWAERGLAAFPQERRGPLRDFVVGACLRRKQYDRALDLRWSEFEASPGLDTYDNLRASATAARAWPAWREKALALLRADAAKRQSSHWASGSSSVLVEIHLHENDLPAALAQARAGACHGELRMRLARACETDYPADAAEMYRGCLEGIIGRMNNAAYDEAAATLRKIGSLMRRLGQGAGFLDLLGTAMTRHKAKRNLMQRLEKVAAEARKAATNGGRQAR
jgi:uncharacterized Zn finger protein